MKRVLKVAGYTAVFLTFACLLAHFYTPHMAAKGLAFEPHYLLFFHKEAHSSNMQKPKIILVGPSYTAFLGKPRGSENLGLCNASQEETQFVIEKYTTSKDKIIYLLNLWEVTHRIDNTIRDEVRYPLVRDIVLLKEKVRSKIHVTNPSSEDVLPKVGEERLNMIRQAFGNPDLSIMRARTIEAQLDDLSTFEDIPTDRLEYYHDLTKMNRNICFIHVPLPDLKRTEDEQLNELILHMKQLEGKFLRGLMEAGVPYIACSFDASEYNDLFHLNGNGMGKLIEEMDDEKCFDLKAKELSLVQERRAQEK